METPAQIYPEEVWGQAIGLARTAGLTLDAFAKLAAKLYITQSLVRHKGNQCHAAKELGVHRNTMHRAIQELGINIYGIVTQTRPKRRRFKKYPAPAIAAHDKAQQGMNYRVAE